MANFLPNYIPENLLSVRRICKEAGTDPTVNGGAERMRAVSEAYHSAIQTKQGYFTLKVTCKESGKESEYVFYTSDFELTDRKSVV